MNWEDFEIITYGPEFKNEIIELQKYLWGPDLANNEAYFEWKHKQNPFHDEPLIYLCRYNGRVIGMTGFIGATWQVGDPPEIISIPCGGDSVIHPDYRNLGLFKQLNEFSLTDVKNRGFEYVFALSAAQVTYFSFLMLGWRSAGVITQYQYPHFTPNAVRKTNVIRRIPVLPKIYRQLKKILKSQSPSSSRRINVFCDLDNSSILMDNIRLKNVSLSHVPKPEEMAELVERIGFDGRIRHLRNEKYFSWRFNNPRSRYRFLFWENSSLEGYLVLQTQYNENSQEVCIVDWEATTDQVREELLYAAMDWGNFTAVKIWTISLSENMKALLKKYGFTREENGFNPSVLIKDADTNSSGENYVLGERKLLEAQNWDLRAIYSDGY